MSAPAPSNLRLLAVGAMAIALGVLAGLMPLAMERFGPAVLLLLLVGVAALVLLAYSPELPILTVVALVPLFPATSSGSLVAGFSAQGAALRSALMVAAIGLAVLALGGRIPKPIAPLRPVVAALGVVAAVGLVTTVPAAGTEQPVVDLIQQRVGQPIVWAFLLALFAALIARGHSAKRRLLFALSVAVVGEATFVAFEFASGAAFDSVRGFTRAQGTVGANFVSAFAMLGFFAALAELRIARTSGDRTLRLVGLATLGAASFLLVGVVSRGGVIGLAAGLTYLFVADAEFRRRARIGVALGVVLLIGSLFTPAGSLWTERLNSDAVSKFDRPATWVSGVRIGLDNPLTGLGDGERLLDAVEARNRYRFTPAGQTGIIPHNSWILSFAQGGAISLLAFTALTVLAAAAVIRRPLRDTESRFYVAGLIGLGVIAVINNVFSHPELMVTAMLLLALACVPTRFTGAWGRPAGRV